MRTFASSLKKNMNHSGRRVLNFFLALLLVVLLSGTAVLKSKADFGDFSGESDYGSSSDWGSSSSDWGSSSSDWGSSSSDWGSSSSSSTYYVGDYDDDDADAGFSFMAFLIVVIIVIVILRMNSKKSKPTPQGARRTPDSELMPLSEYKKQDPGFDEAALREKLSNLYVQMQNCWTDRDLTPLEPYFSAPMFAQFSRQANAMKTAGKTNYVEKIAVLDVTVRGYKKVGEEDHIIAELRTRIVDYTMDDSTRQVISGSQTAEKFMTYEWDLSRAAGVTTASAANREVGVCPHCGAPLDINASAKCPYCGTVITEKEHDWVICGIKGISQQTV